MHDVYRSNFTVTDHKYSNMPFLFMFSGQLQSNRRQKREQMAHNWYLASSGKVRK